jgi:aminoglycoside phosphotransferase (APT) family kinase protein
MPEPFARDLERTRLQLAQWFESKLPGTTSVTLSELIKPGGSGYSSDTLIFDLSYSEAGEIRSRKAVIRIEPDPAAFSVFPFYDVGIQFDLMKALGETSDVPVPKMLWRERDAAVLGGPFYVMDHVPGQIPADNPPFPTEGFVFEASPAQREKLWWSGIEAMTRVHKVDWKSLGIERLSWSHLGATPIERHLRFYERYFEWAKRGQPQPVAEAALEWLQRNMPVGEPVGLCWGDARIGNQIFQDFEVTALLDWEMATVGNPVLDLSWWLFVDEVNMRGNGIPGMERPRLEGLPGPGATVARWEELLGRKAEHLPYYQVFAGFRFAAVMIRIMQQQVAYGTFPEEVGLVLERNNVVTQLLAEIMNLPPPE